MEKKKALNLWILTSLTRKYHEEVGCKKIKYIEFKGENPKDTELEDYHKYIAISEDGSIVPGDAISMRYYVVILSAVVISKSCKADY